MARQSLVRDFMLFIKHEKKWWLLPLIVVLMIVGALILFASTSPLAPFLYPALLAARNNIRNAIRHVLAHRREDVLASLADAITSPPITAPTDRKLPQP